VPVGRAANIELRNMHLTYAGTWCVALPLPSPLASSSELTFPLFLLALAPRYRFALSLATAFMFFRLMRRPTTVTAAQYRSASKQL